VKRKYGPVFVAVKVQSPWYLVEPLDVNVVFPSLAFNFRGVHTQ